jgi:hypothetical protein
VLVVSLVPYDQYLPMIFQGEESSIMIRGFTHGYDYYAPEKSVAFHIYAIKKNIDRRTRHKFWENDTLYKGALEKATARMNGITGLLGRDNKNSSNGSSGRKKSFYFDKEEDKYGMGHIRSREEYFLHFGIHPESGTVENQLCSFVQKDMHLLFTQYLRPDGIGIDYSKIEYTFNGSSFVNAS